RLGRHQLLFHERERRRRRLRARRCRFGPCQLPGRALLGSAGPTWNDDPLGDGGIGRRPLPESLVNRRSDSGQVTVFVVGIMAALLVLAGLVVDGGDVLAARQVAMENAQAAARAGAQAISLSAYRSIGQLVLQPPPPE